MVRQDQLRFSAFTAAPSDTDGFLGSARFWAFLSAFPGVLAASLLFLSVKQLSIPGAAMVAVGITFVLPIEYAIFAFLGYLSIEGALKINSNYNHIVHVGSDLLLGALLMRSFFDQRSQGFSKYPRTPFFRVVAVFSVWILLQYANPFGLGLLPSIAGTKVYMSMIFFFFLVFHHLERKHIEAIFLCVVVLSTIQAGLATVEYLYGQSWVLALHPRYKAICGVRFIGSLYRPFGTTAVPGGPSVWIFLTSPMAMYLLIKPGARISSIVAACVFFAVSVPALFFCQVRTAMVIWIAGAIGVGAFPGAGFKKRFSRIMTIVALASIPAFPYLQAFFFAPDPAELQGNPAAQQALASAVVSSDGKGKDGGLSSEQVTQLTDRLGSLTKKSAFTGARSGALDAMLELAHQTVFGIGLSRVGAASALWSAQIAADPYFGDKWSFGDNLYRVIFTELGLPGLFAWLGMVLIIATFLFKAALRSPLPIDHFLVWSCSVPLVLLLLGGWGSEGILYTPVSTMFWLYIAVGLKEVHSG